MMPKRGFVPLEKFDGVYVRPSPATDERDASPEGVEGDLEKLHTITTPRLTALGYVVRIGAGLLGAGLLVLTYKIGKGSGRAAAREEMESQVETGTPNIPLPMPLSSVG